MSSAQISRQFLPGHQHVLFRVRSGFFGEALEESCIDNVAVKRRRARGKRVEATTNASSSQVQEQRELLEEMGVNLLSDNSNSCDSHVPPPAVPSFQVGIFFQLNSLHDFHDLQVLTVKDTNTADEPEKGLGDGFSPKLSPLQVRRLHRHKVTHLTPIFLFRDRNPPTPAKQSPTSGWTQEVPPSSVAPPSL